MTTSLGQGPFSRTVDDGDDGDDGELAIEPDDGHAGRQRKSRLIALEATSKSGLDEAFEEFRRATQTKPPSADGPAEDEENAAARPRTTGGPAGQRPPDRRERSISRLSTPPSSRWRDDPVRRADTPND